MRTIQPLRLLLMGDPQVGCPFGNWQTAVPAAMADIATIEHDRHVIVGDLVQNQASLYPVYRQLIADVATRPLRTLAGNGDVNAGLAAYYAATGSPDLHEEYVRGVRLIFLGTTFMSPPPPGPNHICHLGVNQLLQLADMLEADRVSTTFLFSHAPIKDTTYRSSHQPPLKDMWLGESDEMQRLLESHPQVVYYGSGHVHYGFGQVDAFGRTDIHVDAWRGVVHHSITDACTGSGSSVLEIDDVGFRIRMRDHRDGNGVWLEHLARTFELPTTLR